MGRDQPVSAAFDALMARLDHPMLIVTTASGEQRAGCLVGFYSQCGIAPPRFALWLSKGNHTYRLGLLCDTFAVHLPRPGDHELAELFGADSGDDVDKFVRVGWTRGPDDVPLLDACPTRFIGRREALLDAGPDHVCLILEPRSVDAPSAPSTPSTSSDDGDDGWLMFRDVLDMAAGHPPTDRQRPD